MSPPYIPDYRIRPPVEAVRRAAAVLAAAERPVILAGSRVTESGAVAELAALADRLGAPVFAENGTAHGRIPMPVDHPLYAGVLPLWIPDIRDRLIGYDVAFAVGLDVIRLYIHAEPSHPLPPGLRLIQLDTDPRQIGKNFPPDVGLIGDPKAGLAELAAEIATIQTPGQVSAAHRRGEWCARKADDRKQLESKLRSERDSRPISPSVLMAALARVLPDNVAVVEEAPTTHQNLFERLGALKDPAGHFAHRGWALGWGLGCSLGVKLAWPGRPVLALVGDGSALYGIQALWSAAYHRIPVTIVVANNAEYRILKMCGDVLGIPSVTSGEAPGLNLAGPAVDFVGLARAFGVEASRVHDPDELSDRVRQSLAGNRPMLFDVPISG